MAEVQKIKYKYFCEKCEYYTNNRQAIYQHKQTSKHKKKNPDNKIYTAEKIKSITVIDKIEQWEEKKIEESHVENDKKEDNTIDKRYTKN